MVVLLLSLVHIAALNAQFCLGKLYTRPSELKSVSYDFIVVGGGTAGLVIANRLTEENHSVLVLEAGGSHQDDLNITVPIFCARASPNTLYDWNFTTVPQMHLENRVLSYPRGHILGGSSSINFMAYTRGSRDDYNRYANLTRDEGWSWDKLLPYMFKNERVTRPADDHDTVGQYDPAIHGWHGINSDSLPGFHFTFDEMVIQATKELPEEFPYTIDYNGGNQIGTGWEMATIHRGARSSSATSYLAPQYAARANLDVLIGARVLRVLQNVNSTADKTLHFTQVEYLVDGQTFTASASKEIVLSAGSIGTPVILFHSGIGDREALSELGITPVLHLPSVGRNLTDHPTVSLTWKVNSNETFEEYTLNSTRMSEALNEWEANRTGILVLTTANQLGFFRLPELEGEQDPSAGPETGHYELLFSNGAGPRTIITEGNYMTITAVVVSPTSRGQVLINSSDPLIAPLIDPNFLSTDIDRLIQREAFRAAIRFTKAPVFDGHVLSPLFNASTDEEIDTYNRQFARSISHPVSTAAMTFYGADHGVTNPDLKVKGVRGLRIVDASVLPRIPTAHTQAPVYIIAERAADIIKQEWK